MWTKASQAWCIEEKVEGLKSLVDIAGEPSDHFGGDSPGEVIA